MRLTLKTVAGAAYEVEVDGAGSVADVVRAAQAEHGLRTKAVVFSGAVLADHSQPLAAAGLQDGSMVVVLLRQVVCEPEPEPEHEHEPEHEPEPEPEPEPELNEAGSVEQQHAEAARQQRAEKLAAAAAAPSGLSAWMGELPEPVRASRSICELALPCAHNAGARSVLCVPRKMIAKFVGEGMANM
jgi:hypothetical protein